GSIAIQGTFIARAALYSHIMICRFVRPIVNHMNRSEGCDCNGCTQSPTAPTVKSGGDTLMEALWQDIRLGSRVVFKRPAFTLVAALSLALGIGANTAVFSIINASLLKPLPVEEPERLVSLFTTDTKNPGNHPTSHLNYLDYRDQNQVFSGLLAY